MSQHNGVLKLFFKLSIFMTWMSKADSVVRILWKSCIFCHYSLPQHLSAAALHIPLSLHENMTLRTLLTHNWCFEAFPSWDCLYFNSSHTGKSWIIVVVQHQDGVVCSSYFVNIWLFKIFINMSHQFPDFPNRQQLSCSEIEITRIEQSLVQISTRHHFCWWHNV